MCGCVPDEVLRHCNAANPADIYVPSVRSLKRSFIYIYMRGEANSWLALATCTCTYFFPNDHVR